KGSSARAPVRRIDLQGCGAAPPRGASRSRATAGGAGGGGGRPPPPAPPGAGPRGPRPRRRGAPPGAGGGGGSRAGRRRRPRAPREGHRRALRIADWIAQRDRLRAELLRLDRDAPAMDGARGAIARAERAAPLVAARALADAAAAERGRRGVEAGERAAARA